MRATILSWSLLIAQIPLGIAMIIASFRRVHSGIVGKATRPLPPLLPFRAFHGQVAPATMKNPT